MKTIFLAFVVINVAVLAATETVSVSTNISKSECYKEVDKKICDHLDTKIPNAKPVACHSQYGGIEYLQKPLQIYANNYLDRSFEFLLMSTHYANYEKNRPGFEKLYRDLSDQSWENTIDIIKYIAKRGGEMDFNMKSAEKRNTDGAYELYEYQSLAKALDIQKQLAKEAFEIHKMATTHNHYDPAVSYYLEHEFIKKHEGIVRKLSGYTTDLNQLLNGPDMSLSFYFFDEYLQKQ